MMNFNDILEEIFNKNSLIYTILSSPFKNDVNRIQIRPIQIKDKLVYQWSEQRKDQIFHQNLSVQDCQNNLNNQAHHFRQIFLYTSDADYQILVNKKGQMTILKKKPSKQAASLTHNRPKEYILEENRPIPFLVELGVMNQEGKVNPKKRDKFRQVNRFLEMVEDILPNLDKEKEIHIVDFGSGKSYLTFALYYFLKFVKDYKIHITGLDLKADVIKNCQLLAKKLGYDDLTFKIGDIEHFNEYEYVDMVVSLHACDIATDAALAKAVSWQAKVILCVPCCQHELFNQIENSTLAPLLKHGILKERFAALATDAARAQLLEEAGYQVQILEFIDMEHTPKNLLLRAVKKGTKKEQSKKEYLDFKQALHIKPSLEKFL